MHRTTEERNKLVEENMGLVFNLAKKLEKWAKSIGFDGDRDDLVSIGSIALIKAAGDFDESLGNKFSTVACTYIKNELSVEIRKGGLICTPPYVNSRQFKESCKKKLKHQEILEDSLRTRRISKFHRIPIRYFPTYNYKSSDFCDLYEVVMTRLSENHRKTIMGLFWDDKSTSELAQKHNRCRFAINNRKNRALEELRKIYEVEMAV